MKKAKKRARRFFFLVVSRLSLILLVIGLFVVLPLVDIINQTRQQALSDRFFGKKAEYQGVITLWNVDTFEGGSSSRSSYLSQIAMQFEKYNKGALIKVDNLTVDEMMANINMGVLPDMFAFGTGVGGILKDKMVTLPSSLESKVLLNLYSSGLDKGNFKAAAYAFGGYTLISTTEKIEAAGQTYNGSLLDLALSLEFDKTYKKTTKHISSLTFGRNDYTNAIDVFSRVFTSSSVEDLKTSGVVDEKYNLQTSYDAYLSFINGRASMLLGTQRDIYRMENRLSSGVENDVLYQPLGCYTDLVCYISVLSTNLEKKNVCLDFVEFLLSESSQKQLENIGLLSAIGLKLYESGPLKELEEKLNQNTIVKSAF